MFNKKYLSSKHARPSNIHLSPSELPTNLNNNSKTMLLYHFSKQSTNKIYNKFLNAKKLNKGFDLDNLKFSVT